MVKCETVDVEVPAGAEIILPKEGEDINPHSASGGVYRNMKK